MANPAKQKGTGGETELMLELNGRGRRFTRTAPTLSFDLIEHGTMTGVSGLPAYEVLATRPDRGQWLVTMNLDDFAQLLEHDGDVTSVHVEVKRYARFSLHTIFEGKFGRAR